MPWNTGKSILGTGDTSQHVEREADIIFTAAFIGMTIFQNTVRKRPWRIDMEWNTDNNDKWGQNERTADDRKSMKTLNDVCSKVNQVVRSHLKADAWGVTWGLTPTFDRGGMICAGPGAQVEYAQADPVYAKTAHAYLTAPQHASANDQRAQEMYIGRGAYCGLVIDRDGNAVTAMSTICTALNEQTARVGNRWRPAADADVRKSQYKKDTPAATWGLIDGKDGWNDTLRQVQQQGMRFYPQAQDGAPLPRNPDKDIVGYTHGMIRCVYETVRIGRGTAFEMSIGVDTFKLASCLSCSSFMMANGVDASSTHLGRGESWSPYYSGESHNPSYFEDEVTIGGAIAQCNRKYAEFMHQCLTDGVAALELSPKCVEENHKPALAALAKLLKTSASKDNTAARDLYLDAMTYHKSDAQRLDSALVGIWDTYVNPLSDDQAGELHRPPAALTNVYKIKVWSPYEGDACDFEYSLLNAEGKEAQKGKLRQGANETTGVAEFTVAATGDVGKWKIKFAGYGDYSPIKLNQNTTLGSSDRHSYNITKG